MLVLVGSKIILVLVGSKSILVLVGPKSMLVLVGPKSMLVLVVVLLGYEQTDSDLLVSINFTLRTL